MCWDHIPVGAKDRQQRGGPEKGWHLFTADVSRAFLRGLTFAEVAKLKDEVIRIIQSTMPPGGVPIFQQLPGHCDVNPIVEVLEMLRCELGLKDALRLWNKVLRALIESFCMGPLRPDEQLFVWHRATWSEMTIANEAADCEVFAPNLKLILSTHVDDMNGGWRARVPQEAAHGA